MLALNLTVLGQSKQRKSTRRKIKPVRKNTITQGAYVKSASLNLGRRGMAKTRGAIGFCLDFFGSFCIKTKRTFYKQAAVAETVKVAKASQNKN